MILLILSLLGVPLWLCAVLLGILVWRNRALRRRPGNLVVRVRRGDEGRWRRGHAVWVHDVFAFRGSSPAAWQDELVGVRGLALRPPSPGEAAKLRRIPAVVVADLRTDDGLTVSVAAPGQHEAALAGPFRGSTEVKELHHA